MARKQLNNKKDHPELIPLNPRQKKFCQYYVELGNGSQAALKAGYKETTAPWQAAQLLQKPHIKAEIDRLNQPQEGKRIATAQDVMEFFTKMMNGEIKDQFGLDASNSDKIKAAQEIAKRTVDIDNRVAGKADAVVQIKLDWDREETEDGSKD